MHARTWSSLIDLCLKQAEKLKKMKTGKVTDAFVRMFWKIVFNVEWLKLTIITYLLSEE